MRLGLYLSPQHPAGTDPVRALAEHVEQVRLARDLGFDTVLVPQHFLSAPYQMLQPLPLLARLAPESGTMRLGTGVLLLSLLNPLEAAEAVATLDVITGGRMILGVGLGYRAPENAAFGLPERRVPVFAAKLRVVRHLLEGREVSAAGPGYRLEGARLAPRPVQRPRPPIWMAANADSAVRRAAHAADTWLVNPHSTVGELERQTALFRTERGAPALELPIAREACVAPSDGEALALARPHLEGKYRAYVAWGQSEVMPGEDTLRRGWDDLRAGRFLIGAPETVLAQLREVRDRLGATLAVLRVQWPGLPHAQAMRSLRLLGERVRPGLGPAEASRGGRPG